MLAVGVALLQVAAPAGVRAIGALPACRYDDILTSPRSYDAWSMTLVDTILDVTASYVPPDLVPVSEAGLTGNFQIRAIVIDDLRALREAAAASGNPIGIASAYRSYSDQKQVFEAFVKQYGFKKALMTPARPGHSEHQLGVAIDFTSVKQPAPGVAFGDSAAGKWMAQHAWEFGFVMSYPKGLTATTCYDSEPWHFRYVGRSMAAAFETSGLTLREFLWSNFTTTIVPPGKGVPGPPIAPGATAIPIANASGNPLASGSASPISTNVPSTEPTSAPESAPGAAATPDTNVIDPAVAAGAFPALLVVTTIAFALILGSLWLASRRRRPGAS